MILQLKNCEFKKKPDKTIDKTQCASCNCGCTESVDIEGCLNTSATNFSRKANIATNGICCGCKDDTCKPICGTIYGCKNTSATNYNKWADGDDGSCVGCSGEGGCYPPLPGGGCTNPNASNYSEEAEYDDGSCTGCSESINCPGADSSCCPEHDGQDRCYWQPCPPGPCVPDGCTDPAASNWDETASCDDHSCVCCNYGENFSCVDCYGPRLGCTLEIAANYQMAATEDNGTCGGCNYCTCNGKCYGDPHFIEHTVTLTGGYIYKYKTWNPPDCTDCELGNGGGCGGTSLECCPGETGLVCGKCPHGESCCLCDGLYAPIGEGCSCEYVGTEMP